MNAALYASLLKPGAADLTSCDREPIHIPGSVQPHAAILALQAQDFRIVQAGGDTQGLLGAPAQTLAGTFADAIFNPDQIVRLRSLLDNMAPLARPLPALRLPAGAHTPPVDVVAYTSGRLLVLELEPVLEAEPDDALSLVQRMMRHVQPAASSVALYQVIVDEIRAATGFDRVMIYRFLPDGSGAVEAESIAGGVESFLGLHYPESDIPKQARALYLHNWCRLIPDARYAPAPIVPRTDPAGAPLDLSQSAVRSVSPVHLNYLANMGVVASMSLSIILRGKLWGLIACHHGAPRYLPHRLRTACELFAEMASSQIEMKLAAADFQAQLQASSIHEELVTRMSQEMDLAEGLIRVRPNLLDFIPACGVGLWVDGSFSGMGDAPTAPQIKALVTWLNQREREGVFCTDNLPALYPPAEAFADVASGLLAISVSRTPRDYVLWFRPEVIRTVTWAGNPSKDVVADTDILTPRASFAAWRQSVRLHSEPWRDVEVDAAHRLRLSLLEVVLRRIDQISRERETARAHQELMTRELDRRLEQWQSVAKALQEETERRSIAEAELSQVLRRTVEDQEAERQRIARELHDTLGQSLTLLQLGLDGIGRAKPVGADLQQRVASLKTMAKDAGRDIDRLAWEIRPTALDDLGLQTAIRNLLQTWSARASVAFDLHLTLNDRRLPRPVETTLYRVLQEALTNVVRHAEATRVGVILGVQEEFVTMIIEDDGKGFETEEAGAGRGPARRLGLLGMRERLTLVGGTLEIESNPGQGTTLFVRAPI
jgi:light-regulated signal transduction histidine kinase (bacteriophytochrome)